jgi:hypothetical protein
MWGCGRERERERGVGKTVIEMSNIAVASKTKFTPKTNNRSRFIYKREQQ